MTEITHPDQLVVGEHYEIRKDQNAKELIFIGPKEVGSKFLIFQHLTPRKWHKNGPDTYATATIDFDAFNQIFFDTYDDAVDIYTIDGPPVLKGGRRHRKRTTRRRKSKSHRRRR